MLKGRSLNEAFKKARDKDEHTKGDIESIRKNYTSTINKFFKQAGPNLNVETVESF